MHTLEGSCILTQALAHPHTCELLHTETLAITHLWALAHSHTDRLLHTLTLVGTFTFTCLWAPATHTCSLLYTDRLAGSGISVHMHTGLLTHIHTCRPTCTHPHSPKSAHSCTCTCMHTLTHEGICSMAASSRMHTRLPSVHELSPWTPCSPQCRTVETAFPEGAVAKSSHISGLRLASCLYRNLLPEP